MQEQVEELKGKLREANLLLKERDDKYNKKIESTELKNVKSEEERKKCEEKYEKYEFFFFLNRMV